MATIVTHFLPFFDGRRKEANDSGISCARCAIAAAGISTSFHINIRRFDIFIGSRSGLTKARVTETSKQRQANALMDRVLHVPHWR